MKHVYTIPLLIAMLIQTANAQGYWELYVDSSYYPSTVVDLGNTDEAGNIYSWSTQPEAIYGIGNIIDKRDSEGNFLWKIEIPESVMAYETTVEGYSYVLIFTPGYTPPWTIGEVYEFNLRAYDTGGNFLWERYLNIPGFLINDTNEKSMVVDNDGNVTVAMYGFNSDPLTLEFVTDTLRIMKYSGLTGETLRKTFIDISETESSPVHNMLTDTKSSLFIYLEIYAAENKFYKYDRFFHLKWVNNMSEYLPEEMILFKNKFVYLVDGIYSGIDWDFIELQKINSINGETSFSTAIDAPEWLGLTSILSIADSKTDNAGNPLITYHHSGGGFDYDYLIKLNKTDGDVVFFNLLSNTNNETYREIEVSSSNKIFIGGVIDPELLGYQQASCLKFSSDGSLNWQHDAISLSGINTVYQWQLSDNDQFIAGGDYHSGFYYARYLVSFNGNLVVREVDTAPDKQIDNPLSYPNPTANFITLQIPVNENVKTIITYSISGEIVEVKFDATSTAEVSSLPFGPYISKVITDNNKELCFKWVKH
ncbi:MAG: T9SS type A sorting domain-containing protein [Chitinophagales bacterium]